MYSMLRWTRRIYFKVLYIEISQDRQWQQWPAAVTTTTTAITKATVITLNELKEKQIKRMRIICLLFYSIKIIVASHNRIQKMCVKKIKEKLIFRLVSIFYQTPIKYFLYCWDRMNASRILHIYYDWFIGWNKYKNQLTNKQTKRNWFYLPQLSQWPFK